MGLDKLGIVLENEVRQLKNEKLDKAPERIITDYIPPKGNRGCRYKIKGQVVEFIRMNSNSYLSLSNHPSLIRAADDATHKFGVGPGAVRFIDGTFKHHVDLESRIAQFNDKESAKIFNSAYTSNLALALTLSSESTYWIGDELNHNSIIRGMRIANVPKENRTFFKHNDVRHLEDCLENIPKEIKRVCVIFDGIFSMRGDYSPMRQIKPLLDKYHNQFEHGVISIIDDSHGIGAYGPSGRGTCEHTQTKADIIVGTFGKAFGVNGGFISSSKEVIEILRQKADTYIYTNPLSLADCAAATASINFVDSASGLEKLRDLQIKVRHFRKGLNAIGIESIDGIHPIVPMLIKEASKTQELVKFLFKKGILVVGLTFPIVPKGSETVRVQINSGLSMSDIDYALNCIECFYKLEKIF